MDLSILNLPLQWHPDRTFLVPGHGHVYDKLDLLEYRDAVTVVRDRVQDLIDEGKTLAQVKAANPTLGYRSQYGADSGPWTTDMFVEVDLQRARREEGDEEMKRAVLVIICCDRRARPLGLAVARGAAREAAAAAAACAESRRANRSHRLLGVDRHAGLALAHGDAGERRLSGHSADARGGKGCRRLGSGEGRSRRRAVQVLRRARADERPGAASHHLAGRHHAQGRDRRGQQTRLLRFGRPIQARAADAPRTWQGVSQAQWLMPRPNVPLQLRPADRAADTPPAAPDRRVAASRHQEPPRGIPAEERRSLQRERRADRALGSLQAAEWRGVAHDHDAGRGSAVSAQRAD